MEFNILISGSSYPEGAERINQLLEYLNSNIKKKLKIYLYDPITPHVDILTRMGIIRNSQNELEWKGNYVEFINNILNDNILKTFLQNKRLIEHTYHHNNHDIFLIKNNFILIDGAGIMQPYLDCMRRMEINRNLFQLPFCFIICPSQYSASYRIEHGLLEGQERAFFNGSAYNIYIGNIIYYDLTRDHNLLNELEINIMNDNIYFNIERDLLGHVECIRDWHGQRDDKHGYLFMQS